MKETIRWEKGKVLPVEIDWSKEQFKMILAYSNTYNSTSIKPPFLTEAAWTASIFDKRTSHDKLNLS